MTTYAIVGGAGTVGHHITAALGAAGHEVRVLGRSSPAHPVDLTDGSGLDSALDGSDVVIDAANGDQRRPEPVLVAGARRLVSAAAAAGVGHLVSVSIVGIDRVPTRYYRAKLAQEEIVRGGPVPWTIVRSTQFHELVDTLLTALGRWHLTPRSAIPLQPIAAREAGAAIGAIAAGEPRQATVTVAGPQIRPLSTLARAWASGPTPAPGRTGSVAGRRYLLPLPIELPPPLRRPIRDGALTCSEPDHRGATTLGQWLATRS